MSAIYGGEGIPDNLNERQILELMRFEIANIETLSRYGGGLKAYRRVRDESRARLELLCMRFHELRERERETR